MPYSDTYNVVYGTDARRLPTWARGVLRAYLDGKLNDEEGPYFTLLELDSAPHEDGEWTRKVLVTPSAKLAGAIYAGEAKDPIVFIGKGPLADWQSGGATIAGTFYEGKRSVLAFDLDSGVDKTSGTLIEIEDADSELADFVVDILRSGYEELAALGLNDIVVEANAQAQAAGEGRNPLRVTCFVRSLDDWEP